MPFLVPILEQGIKDLILNPPKNAQEAAKRLAKAYADCVKPAVAAHMKPSFTGQEAATMANAMAGAFKEKGVAPVSIRGIVGGVQAFWMSPPVIFSGAIPGTTVWAGQGVLTACLATLGNPRIAAGPAAKKIANCLVNATKLVMTTPVPSGGPLPPVPVG